MRALLIATLAALAAIPLTVAAALGSTHEADTMVNREVHEAAASRDADGAFGITALADMHNVVIITLLAVALLALLRHWHGALALAIAVPATQLVVDLIKSAVERPRPDLALTEAAGYSFPSGHSATSVALYALLAFALARLARHSHHRRLIVCSGIALAAAVGISRVWLGAHFPTDVLAGWVVGAAVAALAWLAVAGLRALVRPSAAVA
jgi:membrane-associated phospholipid phosphatase